MPRDHQDWDDLGKSIQNLVNQAVNSQDYHSLNKTISQVVDQAVDMGGRAVRRAVDAASSRPARQQDPAQPPATDVSVLYCKTGGRTAACVGKLVCGGLLCFVTGIALLAAGAFSLMSGWTATAPMIIMAVGFAGGVWLMAGGSRGLGQINRFKGYCRILGQKTHCTVERLARSTGRQERLVRKDLKKLISQGYFRQGHLDAEETTLITSDETYHYFEQSRLRLEEQRRQEAQAKARQAAEMEAREPQIREVLERGNAFITQIRSCNDRIPGEEISGKIDRMERIVGKIFERVQSHPQIVPDLKKLMDYYLPMTVKLLNAYADMDAQPVQGQTIQASKREIEQTLDTLNLAFEKLLDELFQDVALDVSSDISVLNTILAQEGLTEDELTKLKKDLNNGRVYQTDRRSDDYGR